MIGNILNPIKIIWGEVKEFVTRHNVIFYLNEMIRLCEKKSSAMGPEEWAPKVKDVQEVEEHCTSISGMHQKYHQVIQDVLKK